MGGGGGEGKGDQQEMEKGVSGYRIGVCVELEFGSGFPVVADQSDLNAFGPVCMCRCAHRNEGRACEAAVCCSEGRIGGFGVPHPISKGTTIDFTNALTV